MPLRGATDENGGCVPLLNAPQSSRNGRGVRSATHPALLAKGFALDIPKVEAASRRFSSAGTALPLFSPGLLLRKREQNSRFAAHNGLKPSAELNDRKSWENVYARFLNHQTKLECKEGHTTVALSVERPRAEL